MLFHIVFYCFKNQDQEIYLLCEMTTVIYRNSSAAAVVGWKGQDSMGHKKTRLTFSSCPFKTFLCGQRANRRAASQAGCLMFMIIFR